MMVTHEQFYKDHAACPRCGNNKLMTTLAADVEYFSDKDFVDTNNAMCDCGFVGKYSELVPHNPYSIRNFLVPVEVAKFMADNEFDEYCIAYNKLDPMSNGFRWSAMNKNSDLGVSISLPLVDQAILWFEYTFGIYIHPYFDITSSFHYVVASAHPDSHYKGNAIYSSYVYSTQLEALQEGIRHAIKLINEK